MNKNGIKLKNTRKGLKLTLEQLSDKTGIPTTTLSFWEKNGNPPLDGLEKLCSFYNISLSDFFKDENDEGYLPIEYIDLLKGILSLPEEKRIFVLETILKLVKNLK